MRQAAPQSKLKSSDKLKIPWEKIRNLNEFQFHECLCACFKLSFQSTVKNCINKSIRCWVCNCCYSDPVVGAVVVFVVAVAMSQSNTLYLISLRTFFSFCWHSTRTPERDKQWEREWVWARKESVCASSGRMKVEAGYYALLFITFHTRICVSVCVCACVYNQTLMSEFNMLYKSFWAIDTFMRSFHIRRNSDSHGYSYSCTHTHIHADIHTHTVKVINK